MTASEQECEGSLYDGASGVCTVDTRLRRYKPTSLGGGIMHDFRLYAERVGTSVYYEYWDEAENDPVPVSDTVTIPASTIFSIDTLLAVVPANGAKWIGCPCLPSAYMENGFFVDEVIINAQPDDFTHDGTYLTENPGEQLTTEVDYTGPVACQECVS